MKNKESIFNTVLEIVAEVAECETNEINGESNLPDELGIDSLMGLEILVMVERAFRVKIGEDKLNEMTTPNKITDLVLQHSTAGQTA